MQSNLEAKDGSEPIELKIETLEASKIKYAFLHEQWAGNSMHTTMIHNNITMKNDNYDGGLGTEIYCNDTT